MEAPQHPAIDLMRRWVAILNDRGMTIQRGRTLMAPGFVRHDRRRLIGAPPADADGFVAGLLALEDVAGDWPRSNLEEVLAVRGDRLLVCRWTIGLGDAFEVEMLTVVQTNETADRFELSVFFDVEDVDLAIAEVDRLQAEIEAGRA